MEWQNSFFIFPLRITAVIAIIVAATLLSNRKIKILGVIAYLLMAAGFWALLYSVEIATAKINLQLLFAKIEYFGICAVPPIWIYFSVLFTYPKRKQNWKMILGYFLPFIFSLGIVFTNDLHHWFWTQSTQILFNGIFLLSNKYGFWFWIHTAFSYSYIITGSVLVIAALIRKKKITLPAILIGLGVLIPIFGSLLFVFKIQSPFDITPLTISLSGVLLAVSMIQFNFFNIKPIAKSTLFSSLSDPVFFINTEHIIIEANHTAQNLFAIPEEVFLNDSLESVFQDKTGSIPVLVPGKPFDISMNYDGKPIDYQIITTIVQQKGKIEGYLITLKDISAEKMISQAKSEETSFASFMNEVIELSVNSSNIDQLLNQVMQKISQFLGAKLIFVARDSGIDSQIISLPEKSENILSGLGMTHLSQVIEKSLLQKKTQIINCYESLQNLGVEKCEVTGLLAFPLFANAEPYGTLIVAFQDGNFPGERSLAFIEYSITQVMLSVARLQILEGLEKSVLDRTNQVVKLNTDLEKSIYFLNRLVDTSPNLIFSLSPQDEVTFCNDQFLYELGVSEKKAVIGKPLRTLFKGRDQGFCSQLLDISHNGARLGQYELILTLNLGTQKQFLVNKATLLSPENVPQESIFILINLTKLKNQERKLSNSEHRLLTLFESMPVILFEEDHSKIKLEIDKLIDEHGAGAIDYLRVHPEIVKQMALLIKITDCNQMALDFYGFSSKEELFKGFPLLISQTASSSFQRQIEGYLLGKTEFESEDLRMRSSGDQVYVKMRLHILPENVKDFRRVLVSVVDITERKQVENALANSEEKFRSIIQQSVDGIILFDQDGKIIEWNNADERISGYSLKDVQEFHIWDLVSLLTKDTKEKEFLKIKNQLKTALFDRKSPLHNDVMEITITARNGDRLMIAATISNMEIGHDFVGSIIIRDISGLKKSQADVQKLALAVREISEGLVIANSNGETEYVNYAVEKITGYSDKELLGKNLLQFLESDLSSEQILADEIGLQAGQIQRGKVICTRKDGSQYTLQYNIAPIVDERGNRNFVSVISDVSQNELMEQQNRQAQKLEAIGSLAAGVAHEINTPTQYVGNNLLFIKKEFGSIIEILGKNQQLLNQAQTGGMVVELINELHQEEIDADLNYLTTEIPRAIDESLEGIGRVTKIVQAIKEFSHPSMDEKTPVDLNRAIDTTITVSRNEWKYMADLVPHYDEKLPTVMCSPGEINQVILNLITNASHAIKGQIEKGVYTKGLIEIFTFAKEKSVEIHVKDNGGGIPAEYREKVFNPFFTTKPVGMGTGQGLSISYKVIVNKHNGSLVFDTEVGKGTTFIISLPLVVE